MPYNESTERTVYMACDGWTYDEESGSAEKIMCEYEGDITVVFIGGLTEWKCPNCGVTHELEESNYYD